ncbi:MAG: DUF2845 domain-containing protein [Nitrospirota bacterium]
MKGKADSHLAEVPATARAGFDYNKAMRIIIPITVVLLLFLSPDPGRADTLTCNGKIVTAADTKAEVTIKCGAPSWKEIRELERTIRISPDEKLKEFVTLEDWFYNFGPTRFIYILTFENRNLVRIRTAGYGFLEREADDVNCGGMRIFIGDTKPDVVSKCGEPTYKDYRKVQKRRETGFGEERVSINIEDWTYNFGPDYLLLFLTFENGRVVTIKTGGYGY